MSTTTKTQIETNTGTITINGKGYRVIRDSGIYYQVGDDTATQVHGPIHRTIKGYAALGMGMWNKVVWDKPGSYLVS